MGEEIFELRAHDALYLFEIPSDADQAADVRTGKRVQVWYEPEEYERDGDTYYRVVHVMLTDDESSDDTETDTIDSAS